MKNEAGEAKLRPLQRMLDEGFAMGSADVVDEVCSPEIVEHQFGLAGTGQEAIAKIKAGIADVHAAMPDLRFIVEDWTADGDMVWVRARGSGTNTGPFLGPPTGKPVEFTVIDIARVVEGRIVEHWGVPDRFEIMVRSGRLDR